MNCPRCNEEVLLATECPYCGAAVAQPERADREGEGDARRSAGTETQKGHAGSDSDAGGRDRDEDGDAARAHRRVREHRGTFRGRMGPAGDARAYGGGQARGGSGGARRASLGDVWRFFTSDKVATWKKFSPLFLLLYFLSPLDIVPDVIPLLGWFDDLTIAAVAWRWLANEVAKHRAD